MTKKQKAACILEIIAAFVLIVAVIYLAYYSLAVLPQKFADDVTGEAAESGDAGEALGAVIVATFGIIAPLAINLCLVGLSLIFAIVVTVGAFCSAKLLKEGNAAKYKRWQISAAIFALLAVIALIIGQAVASSTELLIIIAVFIAVEIVSAILKIVKDKPQASEQI
ncbi:MAG TPA: hypothetical protein IAC72_02915 [Candidatus Fimimonas merdipullorum]|uniref:Uncharacterized protein n=1 Tax=Candidatus Fimimonas merdipullorum TaxID=2840822 RepID=A0A9D1MXD0_9BACT|nr:hypothetical protein [Candidatus Fimimonas merdipullorum]